MEVGGGNFDAHPVISKVNIMVIWINIFAIIFSLSVADLLR